MSLALAHALVILFAIWLLFISGLMLVRPNIALLGLGRMASTNLINYTEISLRLIAGVALVLYAEHAKLPGLFQVLGFVLAVTAAMLFLVPRKWHAAYAVFWAQKITPAQTRALAPFSLVLGLLLIWAVA